MTKRKELLERVAKENMSDNNVEKIQHIKNEIEKMDRDMGHNNFVCARDTIVMALFFLNASYDIIDKIEMPKKSRKKIKELLKPIFATDPTVASILEKLEKEEETQ